MNRTWLLIVLLVVVVVTLNGHAIGMILLQQPIIAYM